MSNLDVRVNLHIRYMQYSTFKTGLTHSLNMFTHSDLSGWFWQIIFASSSTYNSFDLLAKRFQNVYNKRRIVETWKKICGLLQIFHPIFRIVRSWREYSWKVILLYASKIGRQIAMWNVVNTPRVSYCLFRNKIRQILATSCLFKIIDCFFSHEYSRSSKKKN